MTTAQKKQI